MEELLTVKELSRKIKIAPQTIYNKIHKGEFVLKKHYYKPTRKKILFKMSAIKEWLEAKGSNCSGNINSSMSPPNTDHSPIEEYPKSLIRV